MKDVCRVVVDTGGYLMAWIGFKTDDEPSVKPVASAGRDDGYTDLVRAAWDDSERGSGPVGRAIRTGEPCLVRFVADDPVLGVLFVSLSTGMIAHQEELDLLREVSDDLAFALQSILSEAGWREAERALDRERARYQELVSNLQDVVFSMDTDGRIEYVSPAVERVYGFSASEVVGRHFSEFVEPEDFPGFATSFARSRIDGVQPRDAARTAHSDALPTHPPEEAPLLRDRVTCLATMNRAVRIARAAHPRCAKSCRYASHVRLGFSVRERGRV